MQAQKLVLMVQANGESAAVVREQLSADGSGLLALECVESVEQALEFIQAHAVAALLLDLELPGTEGLDGFITLHLHAPLIPIIVFTTNGNPTLGLDAVRAGAQDFLTCRDLESPTIVRAVLYGIERQALRSDAHTHLEQLQFSEARFRLLINENADAILVVNDAGIVRFANPAAATLYDKPREELLGTRLDLPGASNTTMTVRIPRKDWVDQAQARIVSLVWGGENVRMLTLREVTEPATRPLPESSAPRPREAKRQVGVQAVQASEQHQRDRAQALADSAAALNSTLRFEQVLDRILENVGKVVPHDAASIFLIEGDEARFVRGRGFSGLALAEMTSLRLPVPNVFHYRRMMQLRRAIAIPDTRADAGWVRLSSESIGSYVGAPLCLHDQVIGFLNLDTVKPNFYNETHAADLKAFADQAATALQNAQLLAQAEARADEFASLYDLTRELAIQRDLSTLLETLVERAMSLLNTQSAGLALFLPETQELEASVVRGFSTLRVGDRVKLGEGAMGWVARTREPLRLVDYNRWEHRLNPALETAARAVLAVPMLFGGELVGVLGIREWGESERRFSENDEQLLMLLATQGAALVHNARLNQETEKRAQQLSLLYDAGLALNSVLEPRRQLDFLTRIAMRSVRAERAVFFRYESMTEELATEFTLGFDDGADYTYRPRIALSAKNGIEAWVARERVPVTLNDVNTDSRIAPGPDNLGSGIWVPVEHDNRLLGVLGVACLARNAFTPHDERLLMLYASQAAVALENARLYQEALNANERRSMLHWASDEIVSAGLDAERVYVAIHKGAERLMPCEAFVIALLDDARMTILLNYLYDRGVRQVSEPIPAGRGLSGHIIATGKSLIISNLKEEQLEVIHSGYPEHVSSILAVPLRHAGQVFGMLAVEAYHPGAYTEDDLLSLETLAGHGAAALMNVRGMERSLQSLESAYLETALALAKAIDARDTYTAAHSDRLADLAALIGTAMHMTADDLAALILAARLHDIGKIGVPDHILRKPGPLTPEEWELMKRHPQIGAEILGPVRPLQRVIPIVRHHQEWYDGTGYPDGLVGDAIPLGARVLAVADAFSAITDDRDYRKGRSVEDALDELKGNSGTQFDPMVVDLFLELWQVR